MSGLYNAVFGVNKLANMLLAVLDVDPKNVPRFRDCLLSTEGTIVIYTRTGGGNRSEYAEQNATMKQIPGYLRDEDDSYDSTYAAFHYAIPEKFYDMLTELAEHGWAIDLSKSQQRWEEAIEAMIRRKK